MNLIRGDSPLSLIHFPNKQIYVYASTDSILFKSLVDTELFEDVKKGKFEEIKVKSGDLISIFPDGTISFDKFDYVDTTYCNRLSWWEFEPIDYSTSQTYIEDLKSIAKSFGYSGDAIDSLLQDGFTPEEIEEYIYCME